MSIATEITRLQTLRNKIRNVLVNWGLVTSTATLDTVATALEGVTNQGSVSAQVKEGQTYTIPKGYHNGSGTVSGVAGGGNYNLQSKTVTPTKAQQNLVPDSGYYGLSDVTVAPIPEAYQDVSDVTATAPDVLANKVIVDSTGKEIAGTMPINKNENIVLTTDKDEYIIPKGYHSGNGLVAIDSKWDNFITPTKEQQYFNDGFYANFTVDPIPDNYIDTTDADALASHILKDKSAYVNGELIIGTMPNHGEGGDVFDGLTQTSVTMPAGYYSSIEVSLTSDIEELLAEI